MKRVISIFLILCVVFNLTSCVNDITPTDIQTSSLLKQYEETPTDELLAKIVADALSTQEYAVLQKYGGVFFLEKDSQSMYNLYSALVPEYLSQNEKQVTKEDVDLMYDALLWHFIFTYFFNWDDCTFSPDFSKIKPILDKCLPLFRLNKDKYFYSTAYTQFFNESEKLTQKLCDFLYRYSITCDEKERYDIFYFLSQVYGEADNLKLKELFFTLWWYKKQNEEIGEYASGEGNVNVDFVVFKEFAERLNTTDNLYYNNLKERFNEVPKVIQDSDNVMFLYSLEKYVITFYGTPIYAMTVYDLQKDEICYYKAKTVDGSMIES